MVFLRDCRIRARADGSWIFPLSHSEAWRLGLLQFNWCLYAKIICQDHPYLYCNPDCSWLAIFAILWNTSDLCMCPDDCTINKEHRFPQLKGHCWAGAVNMRTCSWEVGREVAQLKGARELNVPKRKQSILRIENDSFTCQKLKMTRRYWLPQCCYDSLFRWTDGYFCSPHSTHTSDLIHTFYCSIILLVALKCFHFSHELTGICTCLLLQSSLKYDVDSSVNPNQDLCTD